MTGQKPDIRLFLLRGTPRLEYPGNKDFINTITLDAIIYMLQEHRPQYHALDDLHEILYENELNNTRKDKKRRITYVLKKLEDLEEYLIISERNEPYIRLKWSNIYVDTHDFQQRAEAILNTPLEALRQDNLRDTLSLYEDHYLRDYTPCKETTRLIEHLQLNRTMLANLWDQVQQRLVESYVRQNDLKTAYNTALAWKEMALDKTWPLHWLIWVSFKDKNYLRAQQNIRKLHQQENRLQQEGISTRYPESAKWQLYLHSKNLPPRKILHQSLPGGGHSKPVENILRHITENNAVILLQSEPGGGRTKILQELSAYATNALAFHDVISLDAPSSDRMVSLNSLVSWLQPDAPVPDGLYMQRRAIQEQLAEHCYLLLVDDSHIAHWKPLIHIIENTGSHLVLAQTDPAPALYPQVSIPPLEQDDIQQMMQTCDLQPLSRPQLDMLEQITGGLPLLVYIPGRMERLSREQTSADYAGQINEQLSFSVERFLKHYRTTITDGDTPPATTDELYGQFLGAIRSFLTPSVESALYVLSLYGSVAADRDDLQTILGYETDRLNTVLRYTRIFCEETPRLKLHAIIAQHVRRWTPRQSNLSEQTIQHLKQQFTWRILAHLDDAVDNGASLDSYAKAIQTMLDMFPSLQLDIHQAMRCTRSLWNQRTYLLKHYPDLLLENAVKPLLATLQLQDAIPNDITPHDLHYEQMHLLQLSAQVTIRSNLRDESLLSLQQALNLCEQYGWHKSMPYILIDFGVVYMAQNQLQKAADYFQQAENMLQKHPDSNAQKSLRINQAQLHIQHDNQDEARAIYRQIITDYHPGSGTLRDTQVYMWALNARGHLAVTAEENYARARNIYEKMHQVACTCQDASQEAMALVNLGVVAFWEDNLPLAETYLHDAHMVAELISRPYQMAQVLYNQGIVYIMQGKQQAALKALGDAEDITLAHNLQAWEAFIHMAIGLLHYQMADRKMIRNTWKLALTTEHQQPKLAARLYYGHALLALMPELTAHNAHYDPSEDSIRELVEAHFTAADLLPHCTTSVSKQHLWKAVKYFQHCIGDTYRYFPSRKITQEKIIRVLLDMIDT